MAKTLLILGGARYALPVIEAAHALGVRAVTCDYLPDNYAHKFSDEYINASIVDREAVLAAAQEAHADGIMAFAADPGVVAAAYVAEKLNLPFQGPYESIAILQDKERFRSFLRENGFNCPELSIFHSSQEAEQKAFGLSYPVIAKPVDSAGSKGCSRVDDPLQLGKAVEYALSFSRDGRCIVEQFLEKKEETSDSDGFLVNGEFDCISFTSQLFDTEAPNPYAPVAYTMPAKMSMKYQDELKGELQRLATLLDLREGIFNIETRVAIDGKAYIMEISPRGGGNRLAEMLRYATAGKVDLVRASVQACLGMDVDCVSEPEYDGFWYQLMLHSEKPGVFEGIEYVEGFKAAHLIEEQLWIEPGDLVESFKGANDAFGSVFLRFNTQDELDRFAANPKQYMTVLVR